MSKHRRLVGLGASFLLAAIPVFSQSDAPPSALIREGVPDTPASLKERLQQYQNTRSARFSGFVASADGIVIVTRFGETDQLHFLDRALGARQQITFFDEPVAVAVPSPTDPALIAFIKDSGGRENYQVFVLDRRTGLSRMISDGSGRKMWPVWSHDGRRLAWNTTLDGGRYGIVVADLAGAEAPRVVFEGTGSWFPLKWSPDDRTIALYRFMSLDNSEVHLLDLKSGTTTEVNPTDESVGYGRVDFSTDGTALYLATDQGCDALTLFRYDIATGRKVQLTEDQPWDIEYVAASSAGKYYAFVENVESRSELHVRSTADESEVQLPSLPAGVISDVTFDFGSERLAITLNSTDSPGDVWMIDLSAKHAGWGRWTKSEIGGLEPGDFAVPEFFRYPTFDEVDGMRRTIPAFVYRPRGEGPHPVVISIHGGPSFQARPVFSTDFQFWVSELGAAVVVPNVRGSTGFGKAYQILDDQMQREDSVKDIGALLDWIDAQPDLDGNRVVVQGASYGGYMVLASLVHFNDRLAGGVDVVGISNFVTFLENTAGYRRALRRPEYGDERDPEMRSFLETVSPLTQAGKIRAPVLIVQGLNDPRVPESEARQILLAVRGNGGDAWYLASSEEGHGFQKKTNVDAMNEAIALFLKMVFAQPGKSVTPEPLAIE